MPPYWREKQPHPSLDTRTRRAKRTPEAGELSGHVPDAIRTQPGEPRTSYTVQSHHPNTRQARCHTGNQESLEPRIQCKAIIHKYHKNTSHQARYYTSNQERRKAYLLLEP
ncbi:hypothetical protein BD560DRAFT_429713 [Blakeslea trispora]|nr:hypothetical protein BD560DRAFT_429713 [Blakeslea trispora]